MDKFKNILGTTWNIVKLIFMVLLIIIGIKLIIFLIFPIFPFSVFSYSPFSSFDWNPLTTIIGAILTGLITWFAVYKTSELDNKARKFENNYKLYQSKIIDLNDKLLYLKRLNYLFDSNNEGLNVFTDISKIENVYETRQINNQLESLNRISKKWQAKKDFITCLSLLIDIQVFFNNQVREHRYYLEKGDEKYKKIFIRNINEEKINYSRKGLVDEYNKNNPENNFNVETIDATIENIQKLIDTELKLDD